jgi:hypothetical protein
MVVPGEDGEAAIVTQRCHPGPPPATTAARRAWATRRREGGRAVRLRGERDRGETAGHDGETGQPPPGQHPFRSSEAQEEGSAHEPRRGEAEALRPVVGERPRRERPGHSRRRDEGDTPPEGRRGAQGGEGEAEGEHEQHLGPVGPDAQLGKA